MNDKENRPLVQAPVKRGRKRRTVARRDGLGLPDLPFDVLLEICSLLLPLDLLNLGRVNRALRAALMSKGSRTAWKAARANADNLPEPFTGISEPAWAQLIFVRVCQFCWTRVVKEPDLQLFCRMCPVCARDHLMAQNLTVEDPVLSLIPLTLYTRQPLKTTYNETKLSMAKLRDPSDFIAAKKTEKDMAKAHATLCLDWIRLLHKKRAQELEDARSTRYNQICDRLRTLGYGEELTFMEDVQHNELQERLAGHHLVKQTRPLTNRIWANIRDALMMFMDRARVQRLAFCERLAVSRKYAAVFFLRMLKEDEPTSFSWVQIPYFLSFPPVKAIIERPGYDGVCFHVFAEDLAPIQACAAELSATLDVQLTSVIDGERTVPPLSMAQGDIRTRLHLATSGVICTKCSHLPDDLSLVGRKTFSESRITFACHPLFYPETLTHSCALGTDPLPFEEVTDDSVYGDVYIANCGRRRRTEIRFELYQKHPLLTWLLEAVVTTAGMDPTTATVTQMDKAAPLFECRSCVASNKASEPVVKRVLYSWRNIIGHVLSEAIGTAFTSADYFTEHVAPVRIDDISKEWMIQRTFFEPVRYHCNTCRESPVEKLGGYTKMDLVEHLLRAHDGLEDDPCYIDEAVENEDYVKTFGAPEQPRPTTVHLTRKTPQQRKTEMLAALGL